MHHQSISYKIFNVFNVTLMIVLGLACIAPLIHVLALSFSGQGPAEAGLVKFWPLEFTMDAWNKTLLNKNFSNALLNGIYRTVLGLIVSMGLTVLTAYALAKENHVFRSRNFYMYFFVFTLLFNGGLIPTYIVVQRVGLMNSIWALILTSCISVWNMILLINFFRTSVPKALEEAAFLDGAGHWRTLISIYIPLSMPAIATLSLFTMVGQWNSWFDGLIYITDYSKLPLSSYLQTIIVQQDFTKIAVSADQLENLSQRTVKAAQIFIGALPIVLVYPFLQKYFVKGVVLGSVKE